MISTLRIVIRMGLLGLILIGSLYVLLKNAESNVVQNKIANIPKPHKNDSLLQNVTEVQIMDEIEKRNFLPLLNRLRNK